MANVTWTGAIDDDASDPKNWSSDPALPGSSDVVIFNSTSGSQGCTLSAMGNVEFQRIYIESTFASAITCGSQTITLTDGVGLISDKAGILDVTSATNFVFETTPDGLNYDNTGATTSAKYVIRFTTDNAFDTNTNGIFNTETSRQNTTFQFNFGSTVSFSLADGVYPNVTFNPSSGTTTLVSSNDYQNYDATTTPKLTKDTDFSYVSMLNLNFSSSANVKVEPLTKTHDDKNKTFEIIGAIQNIGNNTFDWGYSTLRLRPTANSTLPVTGDTSFGVSTSLFTAKYNKLIIEESNGTSYYYKINANTRLNCNELVINGRFYGNSDYGSTNTAEIHTVKPPTINGDWNFQQISDGIYRVRGTDELNPVAYGGTGRRFLTSNNILYGQGSSQVGLDTDFTYDPAEKFLEVEKVKSHIVIQVKNETGSTIPKGAAVYVDDNGTTPLVALACGDTASKMPAIGLVMEQIANNNTGYTAVNGIITIDSSQIEDTLLTADIGKILYVSSTNPGKLTINKPQYSNHLIQNVGNIATISGGNVKVTISNIGRTNDTPNTALHPIFYERSALNTNAYDFRSPTATGATATPNAFPMPFNGRVAAATFLFAGGTITGTATNTIRIRKNGGTSGSDIQDFTFTPSDLTNPTGTNYTLVKTGADVDFDFSAGDILQVRRQSGTTNLYNGQAVLWVKFD